jgi:hypothetical protein
LQSLAAHDEGEKDFEQQCDQHPALATHPRQRYEFPEAWHDSLLATLHRMPHTPQFASSVVCTARPPQQRAKSSPLIHWKPSGRCVTAPQTPLLQVPSWWHASGAGVHTNPSALARGGAHVPLEHAGASWHTSGAGPHAVPSGKPAHDVSTTGASVTPSAWASPSSGTIASRDGPPASAFVASPAPPASNPPCWNGPDTQVAQATPSAATKSTPAVRLRVIVRRL